MDLNILSVFYLSDTKTVLQWISSQTRRFKVFVAKKLEIQDLTIALYWRYVSFNMTADAFRDPFLILPQDECPKKHLNQNYST